MQHRSLVIGHPLVRRWLRKLEQNDMEGLLALYHEDASLRAMQERFDGHDGLVEFLQTHGRLLGDAGLESVETLYTFPDGVAFATTANGRFGRLELRHTWRLAGSKIIQHDVRLVTTAPAVLA